MPGNEDTGCSQDSLSGGRRAEGPLGGSSVATGSGCSCLCPRELTAAMQVKTTRPLCSVVFHVGPARSCYKSLPPAMRCAGVAGCSLFSGKKKKTKRKKKKTKRKKHSTSPSCFVCLAICVPFAACSLVAQWGETPSFKLCPELAPTGPRTRGKARGEGRGTAFC